MAEQSFFSRFNPFRKKEAEAPQINLAEESVEKNQNEIVLMNVEPMGSSGTDITGGILNEEYLQQLSGTEAADKFDKMRRSDAKIKMCLNAVKNPIKGGKWSIEPASDSDEHKRHAEFAEFILFNDLDKSWNKKLHEILSVADFGYSLFERVHKRVENHRKWGTYVGYKEFGFRSQRTIEMWHINEQTGKLETVEQWAFGDAQKTASLNARFLTRFVLDEEGQNFEGVALLRPCYGPWLRKQTYLKLNAIGIEKYAVPTPDLEVPANQQNSDQYNAAVNMLKKYVSHQSQYITRPEGWDLKIHSNVFDPEKVQKAINAENLEMVNAFIANFLELGQSGSGSYALSFDQSDFFLGGIEYIAEMICEELNKDVVKEVIDLNFGPQNEYPKLKCSGIRDKAGEEFAKIMKMLVDGKIIVPDDRLEADVRKRYRLPDAGDQGRRSVEPEQPPPVAALSEKKKTFLDSEVIELAEKTARGQITEASKSLKKIMAKHVESIGNDLVDQIMRKHKRTGENDVSAVSNNTLRGTSKYRTEFLDEMKRIAVKALDQARKEVGSKGEKIELAEKETEIAFSKLPARDRRRIRTQTDLIISTQMRDLENDVYLAYSGVIDETDSEDMIRDTLKKEVDSKISGPSVSTGSANAAAWNVNHVRNAFFFADETLSLISGFRFVNPDPESPICKELRGRVFRVDDPASQANRPPLHHNCKSYIVPVLKSKTPNPDFHKNGLKVSPTLEQSKTL